MGVNDAEIANIWRLYASSHHYGCFKIDYLHSQIDGYRFSNVSPIPLYNVLSCSIHMALRSNRMKILNVHREQSAFIPDSYIFHKSSLDFIGIKNSHHLLSYSMLCFRSLEQEKHKADAIFLTDFMHTLLLKRQQQHYCYQLPAIWGSD